MSAPNPAEAVTYLQVRLQHRSSGYRASEARVVKATQKKPAQADPGCITVKVKLRVPVEAWDPFEPEAVIDVPADLVQAAPIEVVAEDAVE